MKNKTFIGKIQIRMQPGSIYKSNIFIKHVYANASANITAQSKPLIMKRLN